MNKVITINLNGRAYQVEEEGYNKLKAYLAEAAERLDQDPDKDEIIADLEQALADKLDRYLNPGKTVVTDAEIDTVVSEMGPVQSSAEGSDGNGESKSEKSSPRVKRLYKIKDGAIFGGVCQGLAAYFGIDVVLMRVIFVILTLVTQGAWILVYVVMWLFLPEARTSQDEAAAYGQPFTAQEFVKRAKQEYAEFADKGEWRKWKYDFKRKLRQEKYEWKKRYHENHYYPASSPFSGMLVAILSLVWLFGFFTLITSGMIFGHIVPLGIPIWVAILVWLMLYAVVTWPIRAGRYHAIYNANHGEWHYYHHHGIFAGIVWLALLAVIAWLVWQYVPESHIYFERAWQWWQGLGASL